MSDAEFTTLRRVSLHMGAHKTASTHLQRSLSRRMGRLAKAGIGLQVAEALRENGIELRANAETQMTPAKIAEWRRYMEDASAGRPQLILSDENFLGAHIRADLPGEMLMYKTAASRLNLLRQVLRGADVTVFLAIRNPADYLESCFSQSLLHGRWASVEKFKQTYPVSVVRWAPIARALAAQVPVVLWRQEDYASVFSRIISEMATPEMVDVLTPVGEKHQVRLSIKATEMILADRLFKTVRARAEFAQSLRSLHPPKGKTDKFGFFDAAERVDATKWYARDIAEIHSIPNVRFLKR